jgi:hypothetical protein
MRVSLVTLIVLGGLAAASSASASCVLSTEDERIGWADVIFEGTALEGATETGVQRFRVSRYLKSGGPEVVSVQTGRTASGRTTSVSIKVEAGSEWRIFGRGSPDAIVDTSVCQGSGRLPLPPLREQPPPPPPVEQTPEQTPELPLQTFEPLADNEEALVRERRSFASLPKANRSRATKSKKAPKRVVRASRLRRR